MPKTWTECHEEVSRRGEAQPCNHRPVVALRADVSSGWGEWNPMSWYPVCARHVRAPMVDMWRAFEWASGPEPQDDGDNPS